MRLPRFAKTAGLTDVTMRKRRNLIEREGGGWRIQREKELAGDTVHDPSPPFTDFSIFFSIHQNFSLYVAFVPALLTPFYYHWKVKVSTKNSNVYFKNTMTRSWAVRRNLVKMIRNYCNFGRNVVWWERRGRYGEEEFPEHCVKIGNNTVIFSPNDG